MTSATLPPSPAGASKTPAASRTAVRPATSASCARPSRPIPITLPASRWRGRTVERISLDDAVALLLDDAGDHPLAVDGKRREQEQRAGVARPGSRRRSSPSRRAGAWPQSAPVPGGRWLRSARTAVSAIAAALVSTFVAEDEPILRQQQDRVDLLGVERPPSGCGRGDHSQLHLGVVERFRCALECGGEAGAAPAPSPRRRRSAASRAPGERGRAPTSRSMISVEARKTLLRQHARGSRAMRRA